MFLEPNIRGQRSGWIEVICGPMFSGKTEELIRRLKRAQIAKLPVAIFKPKSDTRYADEKIVTHEGINLSSHPIGSSTEILSVSRDIKVIGVDEAQFFDMELPAVCEKLALQGFRVIAAGLDMDYLGNPFGPMPALLAKAEYVTKVHAICPHCGNLATHSYRLSGDKSQFKLGATDAYEPRCRVCYTMGNILDFTPRK